jgi:hypothetical protein
MKHYHVKRLQRTLDNVHGHLKAWKQGSWMDSPTWERDMDKLPEDELVKVDTRTCGTAGCLAGWGAMDAGATFVAQPGDFLEYVAPKGHVRAVLNGDEEPHHIRYFARTWFGLGDMEATSQFDSENSYERLWALAMLFTGGRLTLPAQVTEEQAEGAAEQGSNATAAVNFPADVLDEMERMRGDYAPYGVDRLDPEIRERALAAARQQAEARAAAL